MIKENVILLKKLNNWQKNVPWLSHYEEACRTNSFVTYEYRDTYVPPQEHQPAPMSTNDHVSNHTQHEDALRSYNPYLIAYHEDTNTFTYKDPWVEVTHEDVCNNNYNENYVNEQNSTPQWSTRTNDAASAPTANTNNTTEYHNHHKHQEVISSPQIHHEVPQPAHQNDLTHHHVNHVAENPPQQFSSPAVVEKIVEHVTEEVSLFRDRALTITRSPKMT